MRAGLPRGACAALVALALAPLPARAQADGGADAAAVPDGGAALQTTVLALAPSRDAPPERATSVLEREDLRERGARSLPDALRFEPGVTVQQTAHGQGSPYLRGLTGQQTVLLYDGIRLNTSTWRRGPNQYAFTVDPRQVEAVEVLRGGASTRAGADALGGALLVHPTEPSMREGVHPSLLLRGATADLEWGGRLQLDAAKGPWGVVAGASGRRVGLLQAGGPVAGLANGRPADVPTFASDGRTQLGTGFDELAFDLRSVLRTPAGRLTLAGTSYLQYDAPRTDQCPPRGGTAGDCLTYERQHRHLAYGAWDGRPPAGARFERSRVTLSWQRLDERRRTDRPVASTRELAEDLLDTFGLTAGLEGVAFAAGALRVGFDAWVDFVQSRAWLLHTGTGETELRSRGQYVQGSRAATGGLFAEESWALGPWALRLGGRVGLSGAFAPADPASGSARVDRHFAPWAAHGGAELRASERLSVLANLDRSFRAPNLDDLTSRQATGAGYQLDNPALGPETATTLELGVRLRGAPRVEAQAWAFGTLLEGAVTREARAAADCPPDAPGCASAPSRYALGNAARASWLVGAEAELRVRPLDSVDLRAHLAWALGVTPNPAPVPADPAAPWDEYVPLSKVPPLHGAVEGTWRSPWGLYLGAAFRWAAEQRRLAPSDRTDARIPDGGTPAWAVVDLRAGWRFHQRLAIALVLENLFDAAYRVHGSGVNGPGRGLVATVELSPF